MVAKKSSQKSSGKSAKSKVSKVASVASDKSAKVAAPVADRPKRAVIDFEKLNRWNSILAGVYLLEAVAIVVAAANKTFPVVLNFLGLDALATSAKGSDVLVSASHHLFDTSLAWVVALFLFASAVAYFLMATYLREFYETKLAGRTNPIRWVGHGISAGLMLVGVGLVTGVQDSMLLLALFGLGLGVGGLYALAEKYYQKSPAANAYNYWIGSVAGLLAWFILAAYAWGAHIYGAGVPPYLHVLYPVIFVLSGVIAVNFYLQLRAKGKWADYMYGEWIFLAVNFVAQSALAWMLFAGSLRP